MRATFLPEPELEFGFGGRHQEQRAGLLLHGPADVEFASRPATMRVGLVGQARALDELQIWLEGCARGVAARSDTALTTLFPAFPAFPGLEGDATFRCALNFEPEARCELSRRQLRGLADVTGDAVAVAAAAELLAAAIEALLEGTDVNVVLVARPPGVPDGSAGEDGTVGANFHDLLKARAISARVPLHHPSPDLARRTRHRG